MKVKGHQISTSKAASGEFWIFKKSLNNIVNRISKNRQTIQSILALLSSNIISSSLVVIGGLMVARFLGPEVTGPFRAYTIPITYLMFLGLGTTDGLLQRIPYYVGKEMPERVYVLAASAGAFMLFMSAAVSFGFICCAVYSLVHHDLYGVFGWLSQAIFSWEIFYGGYLTSTYRTLNHFVTMARIQIVQTILNFGMVFLLPFLKFYGLCARLAIPSFLALWFFHKKRPLKVIYRFDIKALCEVIKLGFPYSVWGTLYQSAWLATESSLILSFSGATALGLFSVAYAIRAALNSVPMAIWQVLTPRVVAAFAQDGSIRKANARIIGVAAALTGFMVIVACAGSFLLDIFVPYFIPKYIAGIQVMKVSLWFPVVQAAFLPMNTLFATGKSWLYGRSVIAGAVVFALATWLLLPQIGGLLAVVVGSLLGRAARTLAAYVDLYVLTKKERENP